MTLDLSGANTLLVTPFHLDSTGVSNTLGARKTAVGHGAYIDDAGNLSFSGIQVASNVTSAVGSIVNNDQPVVTYIEKSCA